MKKVIVLCIVCCIIMTGCGGKAKQIQNESEKEESVFNQEVNMSDAGDTVNESDEDFPEDNLVIDIDSVFSDGYAWVQANGVWYCIDETGNEVCKLSEEFKSPSEVINGYSVVDQKYVVDIHGNILYTIDDSEYEIYDYQSLETGCIILTKEVDEFERSGRFYYVLNLETQKIDEINLEKSNYYTEGIYTYEGNGVGVADFVAKLGRYIGCGKYEIVLCPNSYNEEEWGPWVYSTIQLYDAKTNSIKDCELELEGQYEKADVRFFDTDEKNIKYVMMEDTMNYYGRLLRFDIESCNVVEEVADNMVVELNDFWSKTVDSTELIGDNLLKIVCENAEDEKDGNVEEGENEDVEDEEDENEDIEDEEDENKEDSAYLKYIDLYSDKIYQLDTEYEDNIYDMDYEVIGYKDGIFILGLENDSGSLYFAVVDEAGKTILKATKYNYDGMFLPRFVGKNIVYHDGESFCFLDSQSGEQLNSLALMSEALGGGEKGDVESCSNARCYSLGDNGLFLHTENNGGMWSVYNDTGNELIGEGEVASLNKSNQQYYLVYNSSTKESDEFWDIYGKKLEINLHD